jgi:hypothetical protein
MMNSDNGAGIAGTCELKQNTERSTLHKIKYIVICFVTIEGVRIGNRIYGTLTTLELEVSVKLHSPL